MQNMIERYRRLRSLTATKFVRGAMSDINWDTRLLSIRGARGIGKTTLMLQYLKIHYEADDTSALYASLDNAYFSRNTLDDFVADFYNHGGRHLFLDEVHKYDGWSLAVKNIYDEYPDLRIVLSGSSLINILNSDADLSRRCISYDMQGLSLREFIALKHNVLLPRTTLEQVVERPAAICEEYTAQCRPIVYMDDYMQQGYYPFFVERDNEYYTRIEGVVDMILNIELPRQCGVELGNVRKLKSLLTILATDVPMQVDITKLSTMVGVSRVTLLGYIQHLNRAGLIMSLYADNDGLKRMQKPDKIYLENTNLLHTLCLNPVVNSGTMREIFFVNQLKNSHRVEYHKGKADFLVDRTYVFEVGGESKDGRQTASTPHSFIAADDIEFPAGNKLPLWLFGMMY